MPPPNKDLLPAPQVPLELPEPSSSNVQDFQSLTTGRAGLHSSWGIFPRGERGVCLFSVESNQLHQRVLLEILRPWWHLVSAGTACDWQLKMLLLSLHMEVFFSLSENEISPAVEGSFPELHRVCVFRDVGNRHLNGWRNAEVRPQGDLQDRETNQMV